MSFANLVTGVNVGELSFCRAPLCEKIDVNLLNSNIEEGNVTVSFSNENDLRIYKYSKVAPVRKAWDEVTMRTRGLIVNNEDVIVARGYNKFFNYGELESFGVEVDINEQATIMDKVDGSLGIGFKHNGKWVVSTAGSLNSEQAVHATNIMNTRYAHTPYVEGRSMLFEIVYPNNRIVTDYGDMDDLVLLGGADINGFWVSPDDFQWDGPRVNKTRGTIADALSSHDPEDGSEGFVVRTDSGLIVKIEYPHYLKLHKAKFSLTPRHVWENMMNGSYGEFIVSLPDEFTSDAKKHHDSIVAEVEKLRNEVDAFGALIPDGERGDKARWINSQNAPRNVKSLAMMKFVAGRDISNSLMKHVKP